MGLDDNVGLLCYVVPMPRIAWNADKNQLLQQTRGVSFDEEERAILRAVEAGEWDEIPDMEAEKRRIQAVFRQAAQTRRVTLRITENDFYSLQIKARQEGIPYQTLMTSILHK